MGNLQYLKVYRSLSICEQEQHLRIFPKNVFNFYAFVHNKFNALILLDDKIRTCKDLPKPFVKNNLFAKSYDKTKDVICQQEYNENTKFSIPHWLNRSCVCPQVWTLLWRWRCVLYVIEASQHCLWPLSILLATFTKVHETMACLYIICSPRSIYICISWMLWIGLHSYMYSFGFNYKHLILSQMVCLSHSHHNLLFQFWLSWVHGIVFSLLHP